MALQGTLETFSVPEVLRLLAGTRKTGLLALDGDRGSGQVWLREGRIVAARSAHEPEGGVEPVLFDMLRFVDGSFVFETGAEYDGEPATDADVEASLVAAEDLLAEWREIESVVPSLRAWVSMVPALAGDEVTVSAEQWSALAIIGRGTSGHRLGDELGLGELDASRRIRDLVEAGLVDVDDTPVDDREAEDPAADLGEDGVWTTTDDLTVGLAGFVARAAEEERVERAPAVELHADTELEREDDFTLGAEFEPEDDDVVATFDEDDEPESSEPAGIELLEDDEPEAGTEEWSDDEPMLAPVAEAEPTDEPSSEVPPEAVDEESDEESDEFLSQLANLSPKAAAAIEATASADETSARRLPSGDGDEEINRNLLLKFLSSAKP